jgi:DNA-binding NarL/FixJ family response regulator
MKIHVLLADGRKILREGLCVLLEKHADIKVIGEAEDAPGAIKLAQALSPDVVIVNLALATHGAQDLIQSMRLACPTARVLALTLWPNTTFIREILEAGAAGCLTKECASVDLVTAIRTVMTHKVYLSPRIAEAVVNGYVLPAGGKSAGGTRALSARERQILRRIADGETTKQIALAFKVSTKTIETHRRRIMQKLGKHSVAELTKYAVREGLTSLELQV